MRAMLRGSFGTLFLGSLIKNERPSSPPLYGKLKFHIGSEDEILVGRLAGSGGIRRAMETASSRSLQSIRW
jgi:hypothetical protein